ncbi:helix-turn-helix domain-containing protein [Actinobaculum suis]|uniref:helix-turn-helix domain-containing protein n=1 Tax=Actinobaculum suis TaxID=1657 RepID=UPI00163D07F7
MIVKYKTVELTVDDIIAERVLTWVRRRKMQQTDLADKIGVAPATLSRKLRGHVGWSASDVVGAAVALGVPITELLPEELTQMIKAPEPKGSEASSVVAGAGFEPTTSGL